MATVPWTEEWANYSPWGPEELDMIIKPRGVLRGSNCILFLREDILAFLAGKFSCKWGSFDFIYLKKSSFLHL